MTESSELPELPHGYNFRPVEKSDYSNLYIETLKVLTTVGDISAENFDEVYNHWLSLPDIYKPHGNASRGEKSHPSVWKSGPY